ncbi:MAG: PP2C family protein-serine/threonine phosphatase [Candidatus Micrarchaeia archaeon]
MPAQRFLDIGSFSVSGSVHAYQDRLLVNASLGLFAVADGVSVPDFGDSGKAAEFALAALEKRFAGDLVAAMEYANTELIREKKSLNLGLTTLSAVYISEVNHALFANVGDSPSFLLKRGKLIEMSQIDNNGIHITQVIGRAGIEVHRKEAVLETGDIAILATDGVEHVLNEDVLLPILGQSSSMKDFASGILRAAKERVSAYDDDKTLVCIRF